MKLQQLRYIWEVARHDLNVSVTAQSLYTSQPGISKQIRLLEDELGVEIFSRSGKHLTRVTPAGEAILKIAGEILRKVDSIKQVAQEFSDESKGSLSLATTHTQARYVLPPVIRAFRRRFPAVSLQIHQGTPRELVEMALSDRVDFSVCTEELGEHSSLNAIPCYRWNRGLIAPKGHPVLEGRPLSLERICEYPLITYTFGFTGASHMQTTFVRAGLKPDVVLTAADTDVIKTYVREGLGVGLIASMAYSPAQDTDLEMRDLSHMLPWETTWVAYHKDKYLRRFQQCFIDLFDKMVMENGVTKAAPEDDGA